MHHLPKSESVHTFSYILNKGKWFSLVTARLIKTPFSFHISHIKDVLGASLTFSILEKKTFISQMW